MFKLKDELTNIKKEADQRYLNFDIEEISDLDITKIQNSAYLENSKWIGGDEKFVCLTFDLDGSSKLSAHRHPKVMAKIYEYSTQSAIDILRKDEIIADYIDIKGDGVFAVFGGENAVEKAFVAGITIKTHFLKVAQKFSNSNNIDLNCKLAIDYDKILVKKIGTRKFNNEVWAGHLINNCYKMMALVKDIRDDLDPDGTGKKIYQDKDIIVISTDIHDYLEDNHKDWAIFSCPHETSAKLWKEKATKIELDIKGDKVWFCITNWCDEHGEEYANKILGLEE